MVFFPCEVLLLKMQAPWNGLLFDEVRDLIIRELKVNCQINYCCGLMVIYIEIKCSKSLRMMLYMLKQGSVQFGTTISLCDQRL